MFERLEARAARAAAERREAKVREIESQFRATLPPGIGCETGDGGVVISGRGLGRRYVADPDLRSSLARLR